VFLRDRGQRNMGPAPESPSQPGELPQAANGGLDVGDVRCNRDGQLPASRHDEAPDRHLQSGASAQRIDWRDQPPVPPPPLPS